MFFRKDNKEELLDSIQKVHDDIERIKKLIEQSMFFKSRLLSMLESLKATKRFLKERAKIVSIDEYLTTLKDIKKLERDIMYKNAAIKEQEMELKRKKQYLNDLEYLYEKVKNTRTILDLTQKLEEKKKNEKERTRNDKE